MKLARLTIVAAVAACSPSTPERVPLVAGTGSAASVVRAELDFAPVVIAAQSPNVATLVAGHSHAAWVTFGSTAPTSIALDGEARAVAIAAADHGIVLSSNSLAELSAGSITAHPASAAIGEMHPHLAALNAGALWIAGNELARASRDVVDRVNIDGAFGPASALAVASDGAAWIAYGEALYAMYLDDVAAPDVWEIRDLGIGELRALAIDGPQVIAGGTTGLAIRDADGFWRAYASDDEVTALAGSWAIAGETLLARSEVGFIAIELEGNNGAPVALGTDALGRAIVARGDGVERYDLVDRDAPKPPPITPPPGVQASFSRDILPWASSTCSCHFTGNTSMADLRDADAWRARASILLRRVVDQAPPVMPPPEITNRPTAEERALLRAWLEGNRDD